MKLFDIFLLLYFVPLGLLLALLSASLIIGSILSFSTLDPAPFETIVGPTWMWFQFWFLIPFKLIIAAFTFLS
jgi:hypothetical protein